jgi:hypothetical protein
MPSVQPVGQSLPAGHELFPEHEVVQLHETSQSVPPWHELWPEQLTLHEPMPQRISPAHVLP